MSRYDIFVMYLCLLFATFHVILVKFGFDYLSQGDYLRGVFFFVLTLFCLFSWVAPLVDRFKSLGKKAMELVVLMVLILMIYRFVQEHFFTSLPKFM